MIWAQNAADIAKSDARRKAADAFRRAAAELKTAIILLGTSDPLVCEMARDDMSDWLEVAVNLEWAANGGR